MADDICENISKTSLRTFTCDAHYQVSMWFLGGHFFLPRPKVVPVLAKSSLNQILLSNSAAVDEGGIAPNQVIARSEFGAHRQIYTE